MQLEHFSSHVPSLAFAPSKNHSWIELSAHALQHNATTFKQLIGTQRALAFVVKANAYGHGIREISILADTITEIDFLCTFSLSEALTIRTAGVSKPIIVLGFIDEDPAYAIDSRIAFMIDNQEQVNLLAETARTHATRIPVHIKVDTGLSRFGVQNNALVNFAQKIIATGSLILQGLATHLSESQEKNSAFTIQQFNLFDAAVQELSNYQVRPPLIHVANSAACLQDMLGKSTLVRVGLGLYGFIPAAHIQDQITSKNPIFELKPVLSWKTRIMSLKEVPAGSYISYNRTHQVAKDSTLAIIPVGYSNGLEIGLSNKGYALIDGQPAPIVGRIAMNVTIVDVTHLKEHVRIGSIVTLLGTHPAVRADKYIDVLEVKNIRTFFTGLPTYITRTIVE